MQINSDNWIEYVDVDGVVAGLTANSTTKFVQCAHNERPLIFPLSTSKKEATLRGYSGNAHLDALKDEKENTINVFLAGAPNITYLFSNFQAGLVDEEPVHKILFYKIEDQRIPSNRAEFALLIDLLHKTLQEGGEVAVSCIGGHGRTGLILAILYGLMTGSKNPVKEMREAYCKKAVETFPQECFVHEWLGLEKPVEEVKPCSKCNQNPQEWIEKDKRRDLWCAPCNVVWRAEQDARRAMSIVRGPSMIRPIGSYMPGVAGAKCRKCWVRDPQSGSLWCLTCSFDLTEKDLPTVKPEGWSKNAWKRLLRAITGSAHPPATRPVAIPGSGIDNKELVKALIKDEDQQRYNVLKEKAIHQMTDVEWKDWLRLEFGRSK